MKTQPPKFRSLLLGFALCAAGFAAGAVAQQQQTPPPVEAKGTGFLLLMTVDMGEDDTPVEFVIDGKMSAGDCVAAAQKLQKATKQRKHGTVAITEIFSCERPAPAERG